jgi:alkyldihydroxyacetonephosphate synthase
VSPLDPVAGRSLWAWCDADDEPKEQDLRAAAGHMGSFLGLELDGDVELPAAFDESRVPGVRYELPDALADFATQDARARALRAWGYSYQDVVRGFRGDFPFAPDAVALPRNEQEVEQVLEWSAGAGVAVVPHGGGTSVVGGVRPEVPAGYNGTLSLDLRLIDRVLELDETSLAARIQAGAAGPVYEKQLAEHGMTMRFYPQSFWLATLGGFVATRAGGHFATGPTHIDDLVESVRAITPSGAWQSLRLPGSGAGPSPDRMLLGSEGTLGVITEAWVRVRPRPTVKATASLLFERFEDGSDAVRALAQSGLMPSNCRLVEAEEARFTMAGDGSAHLLIVGFESAGPSVTDRFGQAIAIAQECGGSVASRHDSSQGEQPDGADSQWRETFIRAPRLRDTLVCLGVLSETFETATTWERFPALREAVVDAARQAAGREVLVTCRFTHAYADGPAPYFTVLARADRGDEVAQWQTIKRDVSDVLNAHGATITHHHAVGRDHRPWYDRQRPEAFAAAYGAAKTQLDPGWTLNPGCLLDPPAGAIGSLGR